MITTKQLSPVSWFFWKKRKIMACEETKKIACNGRLKKENWDKREKIEGKLCLLLNALILTQILVTKAYFIIAQAIQ